MNVRIVPLAVEQWPEVSAIYADGIASGHATFESEPPDWASFRPQPTADHRHVAVEAGHVLGWVAASPVSDRCVYAGVVEHSVYVAEPARGRASDSACSTR
jgi:phosphinothricin acetyltransferase